MAPARRSAVPTAPVAVPDEVIRVLSVLPSASLVVQADGLVLRASSRAIALGLVQRGQLAVAELLSLVRAVAESGTPREQELQFRRPPLMREMLDLRVRAAGIGTGAVLVLVDDLSDERRVDATRRDFVANVSHELKTPVGAMSLLAEAIQACADDPEQVKAFAVRMEREAQRLASLIQDVIDLSRLQGDDPLTHAEVVDAGELIRITLEDVRTIAQGASIPLVVAESLPEAPLFGDRRQLQTALRNLLVNAISYSAAGSPVAVDLRVTGEVAEITVKDQGVGIAANDLDRIFERFYRVDQARSRASGGTGLGLAIVKHVCANHGGECTVWSEVGVGSSFTLRLPIYAGSTLASHAVPIDVIDGSDDGFASLQGSEDHA